MFLCVKKGRECRCTCIYVDELGHLSAYLFPGERLHSVTAAHTRWLSKEGQVVVPSAAHSSVDAAHADICLRWLLQGQEKSAFPYACARYNPPLHPPLPHTALFCPPPPLSSLNQMALWTLFILGGGPRCRVSIGIPILPNFLIPLHSYLDQVLITASKFKLFEYLFFIAGNHNNKWTSSFPHFYSPLVTFFFCLLIHIYRYVNSFTLFQFHTDSNNTLFVFLYWGYSDSPSPLVCHAFVCTGIWEIPYGSILMMKIGFQMLSVQRARCIYCHWMESLNSMLYQQAEPHPYHLLPLNVEFYWAETSLRTAFMRISSDWLVTFVQVFDFLAWVAEVLNFVPRVLNINLWDNFTLIKIRVVISA